METRELTELEVLWLEALPFYLDGKQCAYGMCGTLDTLDYTANTDPDTVKREWAKHEISALKYKKDSMYAKALRRVDHLYMKEQVEKNGP